MLEIFRRNNFYVEAQYTNELNVPVDITGYMVKIVLKNQNDKAKNDDDALINKSFTIADGTTGTFAIELTSTETNLNSGNYKFEIQLSKNAEIITVYQDKVVIKESYIYE